MSIASHGDKYEEQPTPPKRPTVILLLKDIGDTTWRMFLPTIGLTAAGIYLDNTLRTEPWMTVLGIVIGVLGATALVRQQLKRVKNS